MSDVGKPNIPELERDTQHQSAEVALDEEELRPRVPRLLALELDLRQDLLVLADDEGVVDIPVSMQAGQYKQSFLVAALHRKEPRAFRKQSRHAALAKSGIGIF